jgi:hypothetical protein
VQGLWTPPWIICTKHSRLRSFTDHSLMAAIVSLSVPCNLLMCSLDASACTVTTTTSSSNSRSSLPLA